MALPDEMMHQVGAFDPRDAKRILEGLESAEIRFEIEADHSELGAPGRTIQMALGMFPPGSKIAIFVPESQVAEAQAVIAALFPV